MGPPAEALIHYFNQMKLPRLLVSRAPLSPEDPKNHEFLEFRWGQMVSRREVRTPCKPPLSFAFDTRDLMMFPKADLFIGLNPLASLRGVALRRAGRVGKVLHWSIDYSPIRFPQKSIEWTYQTVDYWASSRCDIRVELTVEARDSRNCRHQGRQRSLIPAEIVPMGLWLDQYPKASRRGFDERRIAFVGHLVPRMGLELAIRGTKLLAEVGIAVQLDVVGRGPEFVRLAALVRELGLQESVAFRGYLEGEQAVQNWLASAGIGIAPYLRSPGSITKFADPGKLKNYLCAGLPILMTDVPPNSRDLESAGVAVLMDETPEAFATGVEQVFGNPDEWVSRVKASRLLAEEFDWNRLLGDLMINVDGVLRGC